jgi:hypothetical protein
MVAVAGCSGEGGPDTNSPTPTPTATPVPSPEVELITPISGWTGYGDVRQNRMESVGQGGTLLIGFRYRIKSHGGVHNALQQVRVYDDEDTRVAIDSYEDRQLIDRDGYISWENRLSFDTTGWDQGTYTTEILIEDLENNTVSSQVEREFDIVSPLGPSEVKLTEVDAPDAVSVGQPYSFELTFENTGSRDSSLVSKLSSKYRGETDWSTSSSTAFRLPIKAGRTNNWSSDEVSYNFPREVMFRIDEISETWTQTVTE